MRVIRGVIQWLWMEDPPHLKPFYFHSYVKNVNQETTRIHRWMYMWWSIMIYYQTHKNKLGWAKSSPQNSCQYLSGHMDPPGVQRSPKHHPGPQAIAGSGLMPSKFTLPSTNTFRNWDFLDLTPLAQVGLSGIPEALHVPQRRLIFSADFFFGKWGAMWG